MTYVSYNDPGAVRDLNMNEIADRHRIVIYPGRIYAGEPYNTAYYVCGYVPRDTNTDYLVTTENEVHPDHFSRFGYDFCEYGYCHGNQSRGYSSPPQCWDIPDPKGMAPDRFYNTYFHNPYVTKSAAYNSSIR